MKKVYVYIIDTDNPAFNNHELAGVSYVDVVGKDMEVEALNKAVLEASRTAIGKYEDSKKPKPINPLLKNSYVVNISPYTQADSGYIYKTYDAFPEYTAYSNTVYAQPFYSDYVKKLKPPKE